MTSTRSGCPLRRNDFGRACSVIMTTPPSGQELTHRFRQFDQRVNGKLLFAGEFLPQSLEAPRMARQPSNVAVRKLAFKEALFPLGNRGGGRGIGSPHRSKANAPR